jgi:hypothetical protein
VQNSRAVTEADVPLRDRLEQESVSPFGTRGFLGLSLSGESDGARRPSGKMCKGQVSLVFVAAWAIATIRNSDLSALCARIAARRGAKRAVMTVARGFVARKGILLGVG